MQLYILDKWAEVTGNAKSLLVKNDLVRNASLQRYVKAVLDPSITYGQSKMPFKGSGDKEWDDEHCYRLLDDLASRKLTGSKAKETLAEFSGNYNFEACELLNRALKKDLRCGVGATLINNLGIDFKIPVFEVALCHPAEAHRFNGEDWFVGTKYDGMRALIEVNDNRVQFFTRSGKLIPALSHLENDVLEVFGGWKVMLDSEGVSKTFLDGMSQLRRKTSSDADSVVLQIFDCLPLKEFYEAEGRNPVGNMTLRSRLELLHENLMEFGDTILDLELPPSIRFVNHQVVSSFDSVLDLALEAWEHGDEGIIARRADSLYTKKRTYDWLKLKQENTFDGVIVDVHEADPDSKYAGMLRAVTVLVDGVKTRIGGGWSDYERAAIWAAHTVQVVNGIEPDPENQVINRIIECVCHEKNPSGTLRHGNKKRFRDVDGEKS